MISNDNAGPRGEVLLALDDLKRNARGQAHAVFEGASGEILRQTVAPDEAESEGDENAVGGADEERDVGGQTAGVEGGAWDVEVG